MLYSTLTATFTFLPYAIAQGTTFSPTDAAFDYVVVGGGVAGITAAARLAEEYTVALVEAGPYYEGTVGNRTEIPGYAGTLFSDAAPIDWSQYSVPQTQLNNRVIPYPQGKCLGGGSCRNGMLYQRSTIDAFSKWATDVGDTSYEFENVLPYYEKSVNFTPPDYSKRTLSPPVKYNASAYSPSGGPLHVSYWNYYFPISKYFAKGFQKVGLTEVGSIESGSLLVPGSHTGSYAQWPATLSPAKETRDSSQTSFLTDALKRKLPITVYDKTLAKKILFDANKNAIGVNVTSGKKAFTLTAKKEVIIAAGAFRSPQILMVSGIGPEATLKSLKIPVLSNLQGVGQNMWDQPWLGASYRVNVTSDSHLFTDPAVFEAATEEYKKNQTGPLTVFSGNYLAWEKLPAAYRKNFSASASAELDAYPADWPDVQYVVDAFPTFPVNDSADYTSVFVQLEKTSSRGNVTINSTDTSVNPVMSMNWLLTQTDQELAVQSLKRAREIAQSFGIIKGPEVFPGDNVQTDAQLLEYIKESLTTIYHPSCTCAMGKKGDPNAVVDSHGKVFGVNRLRITDISAFPFLVPGQPMSTVYMLAEKMVDGIKKGL